MGLAELKFEWNYLRLQKLLEKNQYIPEEESGIVTYKKGNEKFVLGMEKVTHIFGDKAIDERTYEDTIKFIKNGYLKRTTLLPLF